VDDAMRPLFEPPEVACVEDSDPVPQVQAY
jgi:hypothetical protein